MKKILIICCSTILIVLAVVLTSAIEPEYEIELDGEVIELSDKAKSINGEIFLPMVEAFSYFGAEVRYYEDDRMLTSLFNNVYCRLYIGSKEAFINGNSVELPAAPLLIDTKAYIPLSFYSDFFSLTYSNRFENPFNKVIMLSRDTMRSVIFERNTNFEIKIPSAEMILTLPYKWEQLSTNSIGISNPFETYYFEIINSENASGMSAKDYLNSYREELLGKEISDKFKIEALEESLITTSDYEFSVLYYSMIEQEEKDVNLESTNKNFSTSENPLAVDENGSGNMEANKNDNNPKTVEIPTIKAVGKNSSKTTHHARYAVNYGEKILEFHFTHDKLTLKQKILKDFENSLKSLKLAPNYSSAFYEHYYEQPDFFEVGMKLKSKIHSNMEVFDSILFEGSIADKSYKELIVEVRKDDKSSQLPVEIDDDGSFSSLIYCPFGVGKHDFKVFIESGDKKKELLNFSAINVSGTDIAYTTPSTKVTSNTKETRAILDDILKKNALSLEYSSKYSIASAIFDHCAEIFKKSGIDENIHRVLPYDEIDFTSKISEQEAVITLATYMRSAGIPCRLIWGENSLKRRYFATCLINGNWYTYDICGDHYAARGDVETFDSDSPLPEEMFKVLKHINLEDYLLLFDKTYESSY